MRRLLPFKFALVTLIAISSIVKAQDSAPIAEADDDVVTAPVMVADEQASVSDEAIPSNPSGDESAVLMGDCLGCPQNVIDCQPSPCFQHYFQPCTDYSQIGLIAYQEPVDSVPVILPDTNSVVTDGSFAPMPSGQVPMQDLGPATQIFGAPTAGCSNCGATVSSPVYNGGYSVNGCVDCNYQYGPRLRRRGGGRRVFRR